VVLASGFYEWHTDESGKWPWFISCGDGDVFAMAGLWELWEKGPDESLRSCTIITRPANDFMGRLHHRMPVIMGGVQMHGWLQEGVAKDQLSEMLMGSQDIDLKAWRVSRKVNNPINDSAELIEEMAL
jgi:putative SOS response-associated peptidase YedK